MADDWRVRALCGPATAEWFDRGRALNDLNLAALDMCRRCPVRRECADDVLNLPDGLRAGIIAGGLVFDGSGEQATPAQLHQEIRNKQSRDSHRRRREAERAVEREERSWLALCELCGREFTAAHPDRRQCREPDCERDRWREVKRRTRAQVAA